MFVRTVDEGLERMLRAQLPLPEDLGDISFDTPTGSWAAQLARITVNLYLYDVARSSQPARAATQRVDANGNAERRAPQPMVQLSYLVSAWAGNPRDEHQLLGDVISRFAAQTVLPAEYLPAQLSSSVNLAFGDDERNRPRDIWAGAGSQLKASFVVQATVAADTFDWQDQAPLVTSIEALVPPRPPGRQA
jgi:Pvc16 N-terminal domain